MLCSTRNRRPIPVPDWYRQWVEFHRAAFGLYAGFADSGAAWWAIFDSLKATRDELVAATRSMQLDGSLVPKRGERGGYEEGQEAAHLRAVQTLVGQQRDQARRREAERDAPGGGWECSLCQNSGFVRVPHHRWVKDGKWQPYTHIEGEPLYHSESVHCRCHYGDLTYAAVVKRYEKQGRSLPQAMPTLSTYEARVLAHWREEINRVEREKRARRDAEQGPRPKFTTIREYLQSFAEELKLKRSEVKA